MLEDLENAEDESIFIFHLCAHNPTGFDPSPAQWETIMEIALRKNHFCAFDSAYQGLASGDLDKDAYALRLFAQNTDRICLFQSFSKNFGLYGERAGCLSFVCNNTRESEIVSSRIKEIAQRMYFTPPINGARIVDTVL